MTRAGRATKTKASASASASSSRLSSGSSSGSSSASSSGSPSGTRAPGGSTRRRVLDAAAECIARDGADVSMEAIAERAGVTRMTVYRTLGTRDELLVAVLLDQSRVVVEDLTRILGDDGRPFPDRVVDAVVLVVMTARTSPVLRVFTQGITPRQVDEADEEDRFLGAVWALFLPFFDAAGERGELRAEPRRVLDWVLRQILLQLSVPGAFGDDEAALRQELELFLVPALHP